MVLHNIHTNIDLIYLNISIPILYYCLHVLDSKRN